MKFLTLMCLMLVVVKTSGKARQCGFPGEPDNGYVMPKKDLYNEDEQVTYSCKSPYATLKSESSEQMRRTCKCSGMWNGTVPTCNYYDLLWDNPLTGSGIADFSNMVDDDNTTCSQLFLPNGELSSEITVFNSSIGSINSFQLQVQFGKIAIGPSCGEPEHPTNGDVSVALGTSALYTCDTGYELFGQARRECSLSKGEMVWTHKMPICITPSEKKCHTLPKVQNGYLVDTGCLAILVCFPGYTLGSTNRQAYCSESTSWTWKWNITDQRFVSHGEECVKGRGDLILLSLNIVYALAFLGLVLSILLAYCIYRRRKSVSDETLSPLLRVFFRRK